MILEVLGMWNCSDILYFNMLKRCVGKFLFLVFDDVGGFLKVSVWDFVVF